MVKLGSFLLKRVCENACLPEKGEVFVGFCGVSVICSFFIFLLPYPQQSILIVMYALYKGWGYLSSEFLFIFTTKNHEEKKQIIIFQPLTE